MTMAGFVQRVRVRDENETGNHKRDSDNDECHSDYRVSRTLNSTEEHRLRAQPQREEDLADIAHLVACLAKEPVRLVTPVRGAYDAISRTNCHTSASIHGSNTPSCAELLSSLSRNTPTVCLTGAPATVTALCSVRRRSVMKTSTGLCLSLVACARRAMQAMSCRASLREQQPGTLTMEGAHQ